MPNFTGNRLGTRPFGNGDDLLTNLVGKGTLSGLRRLGDACPFAPGVLRSGNMLEVGPALFLEPIAGTCPDPSEKELPRRSISGPQSQ